MSKPRKRVAFADVTADIAQAVLDFVRDRYDFEVTRERDAQYVIHGPGGYDVLKYQGVRIFVTGENVSPHFGISDYAMAHDKLEFGDRYIWLPLIKLYREAYAALKAPRRPAEEVMRGKTDFCAYVMSNTSKSADERERIFELLGGYKKVNSGGRWRNNVGGRVPDKLAFQSKHKFVLALENCSFAGYLTEKFAQAAQAEAVPIYWGDPDIGELFNRRAFVNCHDFGSLEEVVEEVKRIDRDEGLYRRMLSEPWFPNGEEPQCLRDETFAAFLCNIFDQEHEKAFRRNRGRWGRKNEQHLYDMYHRPHVQAFKLVRRGWRAFWHVLIPRRKKYR